MVSEPPLILAFDTAAAHCAALLVRGDRILSSRDEPMDRGQAERLLPMLQEMLVQSRTSWAELDGLAVVTGPGNFTGVRLAVAAARGLSLALGIPAVGISRFEALADRPGPTLVTLRDKRGSMAQAFSDGIAVGLPGDADTVNAAADATRIGEADTDLVVIARLAGPRLGTAPPPAPLYLRPADAIPPSEAPPRIIDVT